MTSDMLEVLENHAPEWLMGGYYQCKAGGCFFITAPGHNSWREFASHLHDLIGGLD